MKLFIIPSWYPSASYPSTGIFFKEQAQILARKKPEWNVGLSLWGSHEPALWIRYFKPLEALIKLNSRFAIKSHEKILEANCIEFFTPAHTWTRRIKRGNMQKIIEANEDNLKKYMNYFGKPDMLLAEIAYPAGWIAMKLSKKFKIPYIVREQSSPFPLLSFANDYRKFLLPPLQHAEAVLAVGKNLIAELKAFGIEAKPAINFIDMDFFTIKPKKNDLTRKIFSLGRLLDQKGFDLLLTSLSQLADPSWELKLGGSGPQLKSLHRLSKKLGIQDQVHFLGELDRLQVKEQMQDCDFFALTSRHESFGVVLIEAMACGKPVLVTRCGGITDQLPDQLGIRCEQDQSSITEGLNKLLNGYDQYDPQQIRAFVQNNYSVNQSVNQLEHILEEISQ